MFFYYQRILLILRETRKGCKKKSESHYHQEDGKTEAKIMEIKKKDCNKKNEIKAKSYLMKRRIKIDKRICLTRKTESKRVFKKLLWKQLIFAMHSIKDK